MMSLKTHRSVLALDQQWVAISITYLIIIKLCRDSIVFVTVGSRGRIVILSAITLTIRHRVLVLGSFVGTYD